MTLDPSRRTFKEVRKHNRVRDVDAVGRARNFKALGFALYGGVPLGLAAGSMMGHPFLGLLLGPALIWTFAMVVAAIAGRGAGVLYMPSGSSTPRRREYSAAEALAVRGEFEGAILAYQAAIQEVPGDGEAYLRIARIYRDGMKKPEEALLWFRRAVTEAQLPKGQEILTRREMAEFLIHDLQEPRRAAPELARLAEAYPSTTDGKWAKEELARIKDEMAREDDMARDVEIARED
jgi:tetratricopeptide (TPR) repeat protein